MLSKKEQSNMRALQNNEAGEVKQGLPEHELIAAIIFRAFADLEDQVEAPSAKRYLLNSQIFEEDCLQLGLSPEFLRRKAVEIIKRNIKTFRVRSRLGKTTKGLGKIRRRIK